MKTENRKSMEDLLSRSDVQKEYGISYSTQNRLKIAFKRWPGHRAQKARRREVESAINSDVRMLSSGRAPVYCGEKIGANEFITIRQNDFRIEIKQERIESALMAQALVNQCYPEKNLEEKKEIQEILQVLPRSVLDLFQDMLSVRELEPNPSKVHTAGNTEAKPDPARINGYELKIKVSEYSPYQIDEDMIEDLSWIYDNPDEMYLESLQGILIELANDAFRIADNPKHYLTFGISVEFQELARLSDLGIEDPTLRNYYEGINGIIYAAQEHHFLKRDFDDVMELAEEGN